MSASRRSVSIDPRIQQRRLKADLTRRLQDALHDESAAAGVQAALKHALIVQAVLDEMWETLKGCNLSTVNLCAKHTALAQEGCRRLIASLREPLEAREARLQ